MIANAKKRKRNPLRIDPTRTSGLRRAFIAEVRRRFARIKLEIIKLVRDEDAFGLIANPNVILNSVTVNKRWQYQTNPEKLRAFKAWLKQQLASTLTGRREEDLWKLYVEDGFRRGAGRAFDDTKRARRALPGTAESREEFLRSSFGRPVAVEKVKILASRSFDDLEDISTTMSNRIVRKLADGLVRGMGPIDIAREMAGEVDISRGRAETIARTEIIRAHAEGQLQALEDMGVEEVGAMVEWEVTLDEALCPRCEAMQGVVLKLDEARGMIPLHPGCRCAWLPANVGEDKSEQVRGKARIESALDRADAEPGETISRSRPQSILNAELLEFSRFIMNCGGPGSGVPGPCPKDRPKERKRERPRAQKKEFRKAVAKAIEEEVFDVVEVIESGDSAEKVAEGHKTYLSKLNPDVKLAVRNYTDEDFSEVNSQMRSCPPKFDCVTGKTRNVMLGVEKAIAKAPLLASPVESFRGIAVPPHLAAEILNSAMKLKKSGKPMKFPSLTSTSLNEKVAKDFGGKKSGVIFKMVSRRGLYVDSVSAYKGEKELILSSKSKFKVVSITGNVVQLEQL